MLKRYYIIIGIILVFSIIIISATVNKSGGWHSSSNILVAINGYTMTLQEAISGKYLSQYASPPTSDDTISLSSGYNIGDEIWVFVDGVEGTLQEAIDGAGLCGSYNTPYTKDINPGHLATEIEISAGRSLQDAIDGEDFCCVPEPKSTTCSGGKCGTQVNNCGESVNCGSCISCGDGTCNGAETCGATNTAPQCNSDCGKCKCIVAAGKTVDHDDVLSGAWEFQNMRMELRLTCNNGNLEYQYACWFHLGPWTGQGITKWCTSSGAGGRQCSTSSPVSMSGYITRNDYWSSSQAPGVNGACHIPSLNCGAGGDVGCGERKVLYWP